MGSAGAVAGSAEAGLGVRFLFVVHKNMPDVSVGVPLQPAPFEGLVYCHALLQMALTLPDAVHDFGWGTRQKAALIVREA